MYAKIYSANFLTIILKLLLIYILKVSPHISLNTFAHPYFLVSLQVEVLI